MEHIPEEKERPKTTKTDIRKPLEKVVGTCPYHKDCFTEYCPIEKDRPKSSKVDIRKPI